MNIPESQRRELKETWRDEYLKTIAAFANTEGGTFYIGVTDKGIVTGIEKSKKLLENLPNKITNSLGINAGIYIQQEEDKEYIKISVPKSTLPISCQSRYYIRSGSTTHELKGGELQDFILKNNHMSWDEVTIPGVSFEEINEDAVRVFIRKATAINRLLLDIDANDTQLLFKNLGLMSENGELTRAALLLFSKYPTRYTRSADFRIGRFRNNDPKDLITQDLIEVDVF